MPEPVPTLEQARQLMSRVYGPNRQFSIMESRQGWVCQDILTPEQVRQSGIGLGSLMINKHTGVITTHSSLPPEVTAEMFDAAIEAGNRAPGFQVYPKQRRVQLTQLSETENSVEYRIQLTYLDDPGSPPLTQHIQITKNPLRYAPTDRLTAEVTSWASAKARQTGTWPREGTFEQ